MNSFVSAIRSPAEQGAYDDSLTPTTNGSLSYKSTLNHCLDLFARIGSARHENLSSAFDLAFKEDSELATRMLLWVRDIRGGSGERDTFRKLMQHLEIKQPELAISLINKIPEIGRFDDLLCFKTPAAKKIAFTLLRKAIEEGNQLAQKWTPREKSSSKESCRLARELMVAWEMSPRTYRKFLADSMRKQETVVVETQLCDRKFDAVNYSHVPSVASRRYIGAFKKNDGTRYESYLADVKEGKAKINASAIFPYVVTTGFEGAVEQTTIDAATLQWDALPNYMNSKNVIAMVDLSGSMDSTIPGARHSHKHVTITMGLYVADKNSGAFKNVFISFAESPTLNFVIGDNLHERYRSIQESQIGYSTNFEAAFDLVLDHAMTNSVPRDEMPEFVIVPSDMQFNSSGGESTNFQAIRSKFENAGYKMPKLVFWQMNGSMKTIPVRADQNDVALISGFSPAIMKTVLSGETLDPLKVMIGTLMIERYNH